MSCGKKRPVHGPRSTVQGARAEKIRAVLLFVLMLAVTGCSQGGEGSRPKHVVLLTLDTTRVDALSCYNPEAKTTPHLDRLADEGIRFTEAYTSTPVTLPSHATILTGTYPIFHGARDNGGYWLDPENVTLAEVLEEEGYATAAFIASFPLDSRYGTDQGFQLYDDDLTGAARFARFTYPERSAEQIVDAGLEWLAGQDGSRPLFAWLHFFDPHGPYAPPPEFASRYADAYLAEVAYMDAHIGRFVEGLDRAGIRDDTLIVVIADHGEGRKDPHDEAAHGIYLYDETVKVPFILHHPASLDRGKVDDRLVSAVDVVPSVLDALGFPVPGEVQGRSLLDGSDASVPVYFETLLPYNMFGWSPLCGVREKGLKYVRAPRPELYALGDDPREARNLAGDRPGDLERLERSLEALRSRYSRDLDQGFGRRAADAEAEQALEALGYLQGGGGDGPSETGDPLDPRNRYDRDPKDLIASYDLIEEGRIFQKEKDHARAADFFTRALAIDPDNVEAISNLAQIAVHTKDFSRATGYYRTMVELAPHNAVGLYGLAFSLEFAAGEARKRERADEAKALAEEAELLYLRAITEDPLHLDARLNLGSRYFRTRRIAEAEAQFLKILEVEPMHLKATRNLSAVLIQAEKYAEAAVCLTRVLKKNPNDFASGYHLARCYEKSGKLTEALALYRRLNQVNPRDVQIQEAVLRLENKLKD